MCLTALAAACGDDSEHRVAGTPDPTHAKEVARDPYGRSVYYAMTDICKGSRPNFEPARPAVDAVRRGKYLAARHRPG